MLKETNNIDLPLGLSSSMATIVAGGPDLESLHSEKQGHRLNGNKEWIKET